MAPTLRDDTPLWRLDLAPPVSGWTAGLWCSSDVRQSGVRILVTVMVHFFDALNSLHATLTNLGHAANAVPSQTLPGSAALAWADK